jgi:hypothetical protein
MVESAGNEEFAYRKITSLLGIDEVTCRNRYESISQYRLEILDRRTRYSPALRRSSFVTIVIIDVSVQSPSWQARRDIDLVT